jgi:hypothetical protein
MYVLEISPCLYDGVFTKMCRNVHTGEDLQERKGGGFGWSGSHEAHQGDSKHE